MNPTARGGAKHHASGLRKQMHAAGLRHEFLVTEFPGHAEELASDCVRRGGRKIAAVGGDGTVHAVANAILRQRDVDPLDVTIGVIPTGTGNDWARSLGIPTSPRAAIDVLLGERTLVADAGSVTTFQSGEPQQAYFVNIAGMGFDAFVCERCIGSSGPGRAGRFRYLAEVLRALPDYKPVVASIRLDDETTCGDVFMIALGIGKYGGGGMKLCPGARLDDGRFDVTLVEPIRAWKVAWNIPRIFGGSFVRMREISQFQTRSLVVVPRARMLVTCDGEIMGEGRAEFEIRPRALRVAIG